MNALMSHPFKSQLQPLDQNSLECAGTNGHTMDFEADTLLGLAVLENHPRLEAMRGLMSISTALTVPLQRRRVQRLLEIAYNNETRPAQLEGDMVWNALERFCVMLATDDRWTDLSKLEFGLLPREMERLLAALEEAKRRHQVSLASAAAFAALTWLRERLFGRVLSVAERAVMRGLYDRERHLR
jgi:hypothetical protein